MRKATKPTPARERRRHYSIALAADGFRWEEMLHIDGGDGWPTGRLWFSEAKAQESVNNLNRYLRQRY